MKKSLFLITLLFWSGVLSADAIQDVTRSIRSVCAAPDQKSKYWNVNSTASSNISLKLLGSNAQVNGEISAGEWEGIQRVLKEQQAGDNTNYRDCVKSLTPIFLKMVSSSRTDSRKNPVLIKGNSFSVDLSAYEEGDIPTELGKNLLIRKNGNSNLISGLKVSPPGYFEIKGLALQKKFRLEIVLDVNYINGGSSFSELILRTRDDDIDNDVQINLARQEMTFGNRTSRYNKVEGYKGGVAINELIIYMKNGVVKLYVNDKYYASLQSDERNFYDKLIIKNVEPNDYIYDISGYNIDG